MKIILSPLAKKNIISLTLFALFTALIFFILPITIQAATVVNPNGNSQASTQRNMVKTTEGTLHSVISITSAVLCGGVSRTGLLWMTSTDDGANWTCQAQLGSSTGYNASLAIDSLDNVYVVYGLNVTGGSTSNDLFYRKLTKGSGSTWTVGSPQTALDASTSSLGYSYPVIEVESSTRLWIAVRAFSSPNYQLEVYYSNDQSASPTWTQSSVLTTASSTTSEHIPSIVRYGTNFGVLYPSASILRWKTRADADTVTSWSTETSIITGVAAIAEKFSATVDSSNNVHLIIHSNNASSSPGPLKYSYFNGSTWSTSFDLTTSALFGTGTGSVRITTDGTSVWVFYPERSGLAGAVDMGRLVYKKGVAPFASGNFDASATTLTTDKRVFDKVWRFVTSGSVYTDVTTAAGNATAADVTFPAAIDDILYVGMTEKFRAFSPFLSTNGTVGSVVYEYWNGSIWTTLTTNGSVNASFTSCASVTAGASCGIWFDPPSDWGTTAVNGEGTPYYYIRARVIGTYTVTAVGTQLRAVDKISNISTPAGANGVPTLYVLWNENINLTSPTTVLVQSLVTGSNTSPTLPSSLGPTGVVNGSSGADTTPQFDFTLADANGSDTVKYQIQVDDNSNFSSPVVDYTSALAAQGAASFTVGQAAGSGSYAVGNSGQTLSDSSYYWRVRSFDNSGAVSSYVTANSGAVAFIVDNSAPSTPGTPTTTSPTSDDTPTWTWTASTDGQSGLGTPAYNVEWSTDPTFGAGVSSDTSNTNSFTHSISLAAGTWYFRAQAINGVALTSSFSANGTVVVSGANGIAINGLTTNATFNSIGLELAYVGDGNQNASAAVQFKKTSDSTWRNGLPLWETNDGTSPSFFGSVVLLDSGTSYDILVTVTDGDGVTGSTTATTTVSTRTDNISTASAVWAAAGTKYYVRIGGNDSSDGLSVGTAWATIQKAVTSAPSDAVVQVGPGSFDAPTTNRTTAITLLAEYPALDDNQEIINANLHTVIDPPAISGPTGSSDTSYTAPWTQVTPDSNSGHPVWKWTGSPVTNATSLSYSTAKNGVPIRVATWRHGAGDATTASEFATKLYTNITYNYGFWPDSTDIYMRMPEDLNPNNYYIKATTGTGITIDGANSRISGFEMQDHIWGINIKKSASNSVIDHNLIYNSATGIRTNGNTPGTYPTDVVIQYNRIVDSSLWGTDQTNGKVIPWDFAKLDIKDSNGDSYSTADIGSANESSGISGRGGAVRLVIRYNTIDGSFNGIGLGLNGGYDRYASSDNDVHNNTIMHASDDGLEPESQTINLRVWNNSLQYTGTVLSTGPVLYGPIYLFKNQAWNIGSRGVGVAANGDNEFSPLFFKYAGSSSTVPPRIYVINNTLYADPSTPIGLSGGANYVDLGVSDPDGFYMYNNILSANRSAFEVVSGAAQNGAHPDRWIEDYNYFYTSDAISPAGRGLRYNGSDYTTNVSAYQTASGQGAHTNVAGNFKTFDLAWLTNPSAGDLTLSSSSPFIDAGITVANIMDLTSQYNGTAPDLGANEANASSNNQSSSSSSNSSSSSSSGPGSSGSCSASAPTLAPDLFQIDTTNVNSTIYFAPVNGPVSHYQISYGFKGNEELYSANAQVSGFIIGSLSANTSYVFKIRAFNDCTPGAWSNPITVRTTGSAGKKSVFYKAGVSIFNKTLQISHKGKVILNVPFTENQTPSQPAKSDPPSLKQPGSTVFVNPEPETQPVSSGNWFTNIIGVVKNFFRF